MFLAVLQAYETRVADVFVIAHNEAILSCSLPSHAAGFLDIVAWVTSEGLNINRETPKGCPELICISASGVPKRLHYVQESVQKNYNATFLE